MRLLLDTCTFLWLVEGSAELSPECRRMFTDPGHEVFLSVVSAWEIVVKYQIGKLPLPAPPHVFVATNRRLLEVGALALAEEAVLQLARLPNYHRDPFDRMLICQAIAEGMPILTPDESIRQYPVRTVW